MATTSSGGPVQEAVKALVEIEQKILAELLRQADAINRPASATALPFAPAQFEMAAAALRATLRQHGEGVERLDELATMQERPADEADVRAHARRHRAEGVMHANSLRDLAFKMRANREKHEAAERQALFAIEEEFADGHGGGPLAARRLGGHGALDARASAQAARKVTETFRRTRQLMASELERFDATLRDLDEQGRSIKNTEETHKGAIDGGLNAGKKLLTRLMQREQTDTFLIGFAFICFLLTVLYIIKKRVGLLGLGHLLWGSSLPPAPPHMTSNIAPSDAMPLDAASGLPAANLHGEVDAAEDDAAGGSQIVEQLVAAAATAAADALGLNGGGGGTNCAAGRTAEGDCLAAEVAADDTSPAGASAPSDTTTWTPDAAEEAASAKVAEEAVAARDAAEEAASAKVAEEAVAAKAAAEAAAAKAAEEAAAARAAEEVEEAKAVEQAAVVKAAEEAATRAAEEAAAKAAEDAAALAAEKAAAEAAAAVEQAAVVKAAEEAAARAAEEAVAAKAAEDEAAKRAAEDAAAKTAEDAAALAAEEAAAARAAEEAEEAKVVEQAAVVKAAEEADAAKAAEEAAVVTAAEEAAAAKAVEEGAAAARALEEAAAAKVAEEARAAAAKKIDKSPQCPKWAQQGECERNSKYMLSACPNACDAYATLKSEL